MKIAHAVGWYYPQSQGGTEVYVAHLAAALQAAGHEVMVLAPSADLERPQASEHEGIAVLRYPIPRNPVRRVTRGLAPAKASQGFVEGLAAFRADIVHFHSLTTGLGIPELTAAVDRSAAVVYTNHLPSMGFACPRGSLLRWGRTPCDGIRPAATCAACLLQAHGLPRPVASTFGHLPLALARLGLRVPGRPGTALGVRALIVRAAESQKHLATLADQVVVLNDAARRIFEAHGMPSAKVEVNRLGVSHAHLVPKAGPERRPTVAPVRLGFLGRYHEDKGLRPLAEALRRMPSQLDFTFTFRGLAASRVEREIEGWLRDMLGSETRVTFLPPVGGSEVASTLSDLDLLCCPSLWFENGPTVALESMAVGTPVLASAFGAPMEFIEDGVNGCLVPPADVEALAAALERIVSDPVGTIDRWRRSLTPVRRMDDVVRDYLSLYQRVLSGRAGVRSDHGGGVGLPMQQRDP